MNECWLIGMFVVPRYISVHRFSELSCLPFYTHLDSHLGRCHSVHSSVALIASSQIVMCSFVLIGFLGSKFWPGTLTRDCLHIAIEKVSWIGFLAVNSVSFHCTWLWFLALLPIRVPTYLFKTWWCFECVILWIWDRWVGLCFGFSYTTHVPDSISKFDLVFSKDDLATSYTRQLYNAF